MILELVLEVALKKRDDTASICFLHFTRPEKDKPPVVKATSLVPCKFQQNSASGGEVP